MRRAALFLCCLFSVCASARAGGVFGDDTNEDEAHDYGGMPRLRFAIETGYSQWIYNPDSITSSYDDYLNTLESGWDISAQAAWFPWAKGGIGAEWIWFLSKAHQSGVKVDESGTPVNLSERVSSVYYGPVFLSRMRFGRFGQIVGGFGAGLLDFRDGWYANGRFTLVEARTIAFVPQVGWDYSFYRLVSVGINARAVLADIGEYTYNGKQVKLEQPEDPHSWNSIGLTRFEINAGFRFGLD
jgi:hypothetical protein